MGTLFYRTLVYAKIVYFSLEVRVKSLVLFFTFVAILSNPFVSFATDFSHAHTAKISGNYEEAVKIFKVAAEQGDSFSQHCLGVMLYKGIGAPQNYDEAFKWLNMAAKQGLSQAKLDLEILVYHKKGVPKDYKHKY